MITAYDEKLADRIRKVLGKSRGVTEKKMFGGLSFLLSGKMFCGVLKDDLVLKMSYERWEEALKKPNVRPMDFTGKPMKGFVYVNQKGCKSEKDLKKWIGLSMNYISTVTPITKLKKQDNSNKGGQKMKKLKCDLCDYEARGETFEEWMKALMPHYMGAHADVMKDTHTMTKKDQKKHQQKWMVESKARFDAA